MTCHQTNLHCFDIAKFPDTTEAVAQIASHEYPAGGNESRNIVVVDAPVEIANGLRNIQLAVSQGDDDEVKRTLRRILDVHVQLIQSSLDEKNVESELKQFVTDLNCIREFAKRSRKAPNSNLLMPFGEIWMSRLVATKLRQSGMAAKSQNLQSVIREKSGSHLDCASTPTELSSIFNGGDSLIVVPSVVTGVRKIPVVIQPNRLAGFLSRLLRADTITFWVESGIPSANPTLIENAEMLQELSRAELAELARLSHPALPHWKHLNDSKTRIKICDIQNGLEHTRVVSESHQKGVKTVHSVDDVYILTVDANACDDISKLANEIQRLLASANIYAIAADFDQAFYRLAFTPEVARHAKAVLRTKGITNTTIDIGYSLVAIIGSSLDEDWLLSFEFQKVFRGTVNMLDRTDNREIAVIEKSDTTEFVREIHDSLIANRWVSSLRIS